MTTANQKFLKWHSNATDTFITILSLSSNGFLASTLKNVLSVQTPGRRKHPNQKINNKKFKFFFFSNSSPQILSWLKQNYKKQLPITFWPKWGIHEFVIDIIYYTNTILTCSVFMTPLARLEILPATLVTPCFTPSLMSWRSGAFDP